MSPEAIDRQCITQPCTVWAFGVVMWELFTLGATPFADGTISLIRRNITESRSARV